MTWIQAIIFLITTLPKIIKFLMDLIALFENRKEAKEALPSLLDVEIKKADVGPIRSILRSRREAKKSKD